jgi:hypothetical protein
MLCDIGIASSQKQPQFVCFRHFKMCRRPSCCTQLTSFYCWNTREQNPATRFQWENCSRRGRNLNDSTTFSLVGPATDKRWRRQATVTAFLVILTLCSVWHEITKAAEISIVPRGHLKRGNSVAWEGMGGKMCGRGHNVPLIHDH